MGVKFVMTVRPVLHRKNPKYKKTYAVKCNATDHSVLRFHVMHFVLMHHTKKLTNQH